MNRKKRMRIGKNVVRFGGISDAQKTTRRERREKGDRGGRKGIRLVRHHLTMFNA